MAILGVYSQVNLHFHLDVDFGVVLPHPFEFTLPFIVDEDVLKAVHVPLMNELFFLLFPALNE